MKKLLLLLGIMTPLLLLAPAVHAEDIFNGVCQGDGANSDVCKEKGSASPDGPLVGPNGIITRVTQIVVFLSGAAGVIMVMIGGIKYVMSGGDASKIDSAKNTILYAVIGLVIAASAQIIVSFVFSKL